MNIIHTFPFFVVDQTGQIRTVSGKITVSARSFSATYNFTTKTTTRDSQTASESISLVTDNFLHETTEIEYNLSTDIVGCFVFVKFPKISIDSNRVHIHPEKNSPWKDLLLVKGKPAQSKVNLVVDSISAVTSTDDQGVTYSENSHYVKPEVDNIEDTIESNLGKDKIRNLYFKSKIPGSWEIPARLTNSQWMSSCSKTIQHYGVDYYLNNLGYRSDSDYNKELKNQSVILCLGDSDVYGNCVALNEIWTTKLQGLLGSDVFVMNMGVPGISNDGIARIAVNTINFLQRSIRAVCLMYATHSLREFVSKNY